MHKCALCGGVTYHSWTVYQEHITRCHAIKKEIRPVNLSGRSKAQIVNDVESGWLKRYLIP